jgi:hypothetical protein
MSSALPGPLPFETAEMASTAALIRCSACQVDLLEPYFVVSGKLLCPVCSEQLRTLHQRTGAGWGAFFRALLFGGLAAMLGSLVWYGIAELTRRELGLFGILLGLGVGYAVRAGCRGRGGWKYQLLAMLLTYVSITTSHLPAVMKGLAGSIVQRVEEPIRPTATPALGPTKAPVGLVIFFLFSWAVALIAPFLAGVDNLIGLFIIAIALYEAWKINQRMKLVIAGPFRLASPAAAAP